MEQIDALYEAFRKDQLEVKGYLTCASKSGIKEWEDFKKQKFPSKEEIRLQVIHTLWGGEDMESLLDWFTEKFGIV